MESSCLPPFNQTHKFLAATFFSKEKVERYVCSVCQKRFSRPSALQTHAYIHSGEKPFKCYVHGCGRKFSVVSNLRRHYKVHNRSRASQRTRLSSDERDAFVQRLIARSNQSTGTTPPYPTNEPEVYQPRSCLSVESLIHQDNKHDSTHSYF
ncbi:hypothetical protein BCR42DRAFT_375119 [Absidia repens]|uniref:C2H2-type domain-containing protein n=1 Tax=Absidia repens TaxID=90262 RepID=A0A1X2IHA5_9FUNG|nr:hypothetical protein BCR42DRAFT_375119 [Absidia repens]